MNCFILVLYHLLPVLIFGFPRLYEGDECITENLKGKCLKIQNCNYAKRLLKDNKKPQHCGFVGMIPIVCCPAISENLSNMNTPTINVKTGQKSAEKCTEYYPIIKIPFNGFFGGIRSEPREFPHMAVLGYKEANSIRWLCGGTLISDYFVLTAAHCIESPSLGQVANVRLGELDTNATTDDADPKDYKITEIFIHPDFKSPSHYSDIALLKLDRKVLFSQYVKPACLYTNYNITVKKFLGTGWGKTDFFGESSSHLLKVELDYIDHNTCSTSYKDVSTRKLKNGIIEEIQICAGAEDGRDACPGDSGGPLQIKNERTYTRASHYDVVGITSFGKACGTENAIGVYTRVAPYTGWIENIVWP